MRAMKSIKLPNRSGYWWMRAVVFGMPQAWRIIEVVELGGSLFVADDHLWFKPLPVTECAAGDWVGPIPTPDEQDYRTNELPFPISA